MRVIKCLLFLPHEIFQQGFSIAFQKLSLKARIILAFEVTALDILSASMLYKHKTGFRTSKY